MKNKLIGFIGQGFIGRNYADATEERGLEVVRYDLHEHAHNKDAIAECDIVFIAVPTPTKPDGFDYSIVEEVLSLVGKGKTAVIKSTILPGTTRKLQKKFPDIYVFHSPEFLTEATAAHDARHPDRNIIGITGTKNFEYERAIDVLRVLPAAPMQWTISAEAAELIKYGGNCWFVFKIMFMNTLYDLCEKLNIDFETVKLGLSGDPRIGHTHLDVVHQGGRGAGGHCFVKDFAAYVDFYEDTFVSDNADRMLALRALEEMNIRLLRESGKSRDIVENVYGENS